MPEPSVFEMDRWEALQRFRHRPLSTAVSAAGQKATDGVLFVGDNARRAMRNIPGADAAGVRVRDGARAVTGAAKKALGAVPEGAVTWPAEVVRGAQRMGSRISRVGLTRAGVVRRHRKRGHPVERLGDVRQLDLELVHQVRGRAYSWYLPALAAASGVGTSFVITGSEIVGVATAGAAAAPSLGLVAGMFAADVAAVYALSARAVGQVALAYGYDPDDVGEKLFVLAVVNAGTATTAAAKSAAMVDLARLTQDLARSKTWELLTNQSLVARLSKGFAERINVSLSKKGLGKAVPAIGIVVGSTLNWATLEQIVDAAEWAYERRFLLEKYPHLEAKASSGGVDEDPEPTVINLRTAEDD